MRVNVVRSAVLLLAAAEIASAQVCRISMAGATRNRKIINQLYAECAGDTINCLAWVPIFNMLEHSLPFGNWGVTSNFGQKKDGHQFQGWCNRRYLQDNAGNWAWHCMDSRGWYEWNSCSQWPYNAPSCNLYNANNCTWQVTSQGNNVHGTIGFDAWASCPMDTNGDGQCDTGGCLNQTSVGTYNNYMSLYELDGCDEDELVQSLYFPPTTATSNCSVWYCPAAGGSWVTPNFYQSPSYPQIVDTELALIYNEAYFVDTYGSCAQQAQWDQRYNCY